MADRTEIVDALESLAVHCRAPLMSVDDKARWMRDWCEDLRQFPIEHIRAATTHWRQGDSVKFPTPGQLIPLIKAQAKERRQEDSAAELWRWPSEEQLADMSLSEKRRQHLIMAHECSSKAGPMNAGGEHPRPEWIMRAREHRREAQDIAALIARGAQRRLEAVS